MEESRNPSVEYLQELSALDTLAHRSVNPLCQNRWIPPTISYFIGAEIWPSEGTASPLMDREKASDIFQIRNIKSCERAAPVIQFHPPHL